MKIKLKKSTVPSGYNWTINYDNKLKSFDPKDLQLHLEPEQEKGRIKGEILAKRLKEKSLNGACLDYLLEHQDLIPDDWKIKWVFFWGTIYRDADGRLCVRFLYWNGGQWGGGYDWLGGDWLDRSPAAVSGKSFNLEPKPLPFYILSLEKRLNAIESRLDKLKNI